jgi:hypothetical protein
MTVAAPDVEMLTSVNLDRVADGGGTSFAVTGRTGGWNSVYAAGSTVRANGTVSLSLSRIQTTQSVLSAINVAGLTVAPGDVLRLRFEITGASPTRLRAMIWKAGTPMPTAWTITTTDSTPELQDAGGVGVSGSLSGTSTAGVVLRFDDVWAGQPGTAPLP